MVASDYSLGMSAKQESELKESADSTASAGLPEASNLAFSHNNPFKTSPPALLPFCSFLPAGSGLSKVCSGKWHLVKQQYHSFAGPAISSWRKVGVLSL